jgi:hypothetical protein
MLTNRTDPARKARKTGPLGKVTTKLSMELEMGKLNFDFFLQ